MLRAIDDAFGLAPDVEVTVEANPDSVDARSLAALRSGGFTRISFGMQSIRRHVLAVLERTHTPGRAQDAVREAQAAGFDHVNLDLMYGTPGETDEDWDATISAALEANPDHISAYALTIEPRTRLGAQVRHGRVPSPDDDVQARRYEQVDDRLGAAGFRWYEVSNWARGSGAQCRHNLLYWRSDHRWGIGPGAHSHVGGTRWWNVRHPSRYAELVTAGAPPIEGEEHCTAEQRALEAALLGLRLAEGFALDTYPELARSAAGAVDDLIDEGLLDSDAWKTSARLALTRPGRLLTDSVIRRLFLDAPRVARGCVASPRPP
jgi:oxygen-independent coproporphyrinogen-3 oxidase